MTIIRVLVFLYITLRNFFRQVLGRDGIHQFWRESGFYASSSYGGRMAFRRINREGVFYEYCNRGFRAGITLLLMAE